MARKLIAVGTKEPNPEKWRAWENVRLYMASSIKEAVRMDYPHGCCKECFDDACEVDTSKSRHVMNMEPFVED